MWKPTPCTQRSLHKASVFLLLLKICLVVVTEGFSHQRVGQNWDGSFNIQTIGTPFKEKYNVNQPNSQRHKRRLIIKQRIHHNLEDTPLINQLGTSYQNQFKASKSLESQLIKIRDQLKQKELQSTGLLTELSLRNSENLLDGTLLALENKKNSLLNRSYGEPFLPEANLKELDNSIQLQELALHNSEHIWDVAQDGQITKSTGLTQEEEQGKDCNLCTSKGCVTAAAEILAKMDSTQDPCDDFYQFACGGYLASTHISEESKRVTQFTETRDKLFEQLKKLIAQNITSNDTHTDKMVKNLYKSCMNTEEINARGMEPLKSVLHFMGGWPVVEGDNWDKDDFDWIKATHTNKKLGYSVSYLFDFSIDIDLGDNSRRVIGLDQPRNLGIPSRRAERKVRSSRTKNHNHDSTPGDADSKYSVFNNSQVQAYFKFQVDMAVLLGADRARAEEELKDSVVFESKLARITIPKQNRRNMTAMYNKMTVKELQVLVPQIPWIEYLNNILQPHHTIDALEPIVNYSPAYLQKFGRLISETPKRVIANYLMWRATKDSIEYLSDDAIALMFNYHRILTGKEQDSPRWKTCMETVSQRMDIAVGSAYVRSYFKKESKEEAEELVTYVRRSFDDILHNTDWMDDETKKQALLKAKHIVPLIAYPDELVDKDKVAETYDGLIITDGELLSNMINVSLNRIHTNLAKLRKPVDKLDWTKQAAAANVNAYYNSLQNAIKFPAGILQGVFFNSERPMYLNFGAIGYIIAHEITHGFDDKGRQFDWKGELNEWWKQDTKDKFMEKAQCIISQYENFTVPEIGKHVNGILTQGENIADNGGIKESYHGYNLWVKDNGEESGLPGLPYTNKQLFWLSAAGIWCGKVRPQSLKLRVASDSHAPYRFRVLGPFRNTEDFAKDWNCPADSNMNPKKRCSVWGFA